MSKELAQTVGNKKFGLLLALLVALAVFATIGSHWRIANAAQQPCIQPCVLAPAVASNDIAAPVNAGLSSQVADMVIVEPAAPSGQFIHPEVSSPMPGQAVASHAASEGSSSFPGATTLATSNSTTSVCPGSTTSSCTTDSASFNNTMFGPGHGTTGTTSYTLNFQVTNGLCSTCVFTKVNNSLVSNSLLGVKDNGNKYGAMSAQPGEAEHPFVFPGIPASLVSVPGGASDNPLHTSQVAIHEPGTSASLGVGLVMVFALALGVGFVRGYRVPAYAFGSYRESPSTSGFGHGGISKRFGAPIVALSGLFTKSMGKSSSIEPATKDEHQNSFNKRE